MSAQPGATIPSAAEIAAIHSAGKIAAVRQAGRAPFFRGKLDHIDLGALDDPAEWAKIPLLHKDMLRAVSDAEFYRDFCLPPTEDDGITLSAGQTAVAPMGRIDLTGSYPTGEGAVLQVQRAAGPGDDSWVDFPVTVTVNGGQFSTYVQTGRSGPNRFRVIDTDSDAVSNEVTITIG